MKTSIVFITITISILLFLTIIASMLFAGNCSAKILAGNINKEELLEKAHTVLDGATGNPVPDAEISIPSEGISLKTNNNGQFKLDATFRGPSILSVKADGYKPFSMTINESKLKSPLIIVVTKLLANETIIDTKIHHLGDDNYSANSANSGDFKEKAEGGYYLKEFYVGKINPKVDAVLKFGTIIGLDTEMAKKLGQSNIKSSFSTPTKVYLNTQKVGELRINGDNQEIFLPRNLLRPDSYNVIRIETGVNTASRNIDYDDMEFMNLMLIVK